MSGRVYSLKRRDPDDLVFDLQNVSLSPPKRSRVSEPGVPGVAGSGPIFTTPQPTGETPFSLLKGPSAPALSAATPSTQLCSDTVLSPPPPPSLPLPSPPVPVTVPASESKALVLYRPVNPPLFPGGPPYGSVDLPIALKLNSSMLPRPQALDLSGGPGLPIGQRRLTRNSSCPRFSSGIDDQPMIEEVDEKAAQHLQVIPWVPNTTSALFSGTKPIIEEVNDGPSAVPDAEEMVDAESMEVVSDDIIVPNVGTSTTGGQFGSPLQTFSASPWPQYEALQPQLPKVMWSH